MPSVLTPSALVDHIDIHDLPAELPRTGTARKGFWPTLAQYVAWFRVRRTRHMHRLCAASYGFETPAELFARQYPASYLQALSGL
jgi:hypothetical protein